VEHKTVTVRGLRGARSHAARSTRTAIAAARAQRARPVVVAVDGDREGVDSFCIEETDTAV
jgi:hypothetical protein